MSTIVTMKDASVMWDRDAYHSAPNHIRLRLKTATPTILVNETNVIVAANEAWQDQCGYGKEAIGATPKILQGDLTDQTKAYRFSQRAAQEGSAGTTLVNYRKDGSAFLHTIVADKVGDLYVAKTTRAVDMPSDSKPQILSIGAALILTHALILACSALSPMVSTYNSVSSIEVTSALAAGAIPFAAFFLLAFLVAAIDDASTNASNNKDKHVDSAVFGSMLVGLAALIVAEVPSNDFGNGPLKPASALFALTVVAQLAAGREPNHKDGPWRRTRSHDQGEARAAWPEILITSAVCFFLVHQVPVHVH